MAKPIRENIHSVFNEYHSRITCIIVLWQWLEKRQRRPCRDTTRKKRNPKNHSHFVESGSRSVSAAFLRCPTFPASGKFNANPTSLPVPNISTDDPTNIALMSINRRSSVDERHPLLNGSVEANAGIQTIVASDTGSNIVGWDSSEDADNPRNWSTKAKTSIVIILTSITILSYPTPLVVLI